MKQAVSLKNTILDFIGKVWTLPITVCGLVGGLVLVGISILAGKGGNIQIRNNAVTFTTGLSLGGSATLGNAIIHGGSDIYKWNADDNKSRYDNEATVNIGRHEEAHTYQYQKLGIFFLPIYLVSSVIQGGLGKSFLDVEADDYAEIPGTRKQAYIVRGCF